MNRVINYTSTFIPKKITEGINRILISESSMKQSLSCYPRECLCSHNFKRIDHESINKWRDYLTTNKKWCPYNPDGSKKNI